MFVQTYPSSHVSGTVICLRSGTLFLGPRVEMFNFVSWHFAVTSRTELTRVTRSRRRARRRVEGPRSDTGAPSLGTDLTYRFGLAVCPYSAFGIRMDGGRDERATNPNPERSDVDAE